MGEHDVLELEVAVDDLVAVHVLHARHHLARQDGGSLLGEAALRLQQLEQRPVAGELE